MTTNYDPVNIRGGFYLLVLLLLSIVLSLSFKGPIKSLFVSFSFFSGVAIIMYLIDLNYMMKLNKEGKINKYKFQSCPEGYKKHILIGTGENTADNDNPDGNGLPNNSKIVSCIGDSAELPNNPDYYSSNYNDLFILGFHGEEKIGNANKNPCKNPDGSGELKNGNCFNEPTLMKEKCERINSFHTNDDTNGLLKNAINNNWNEYNTYCKL